MSRPSLGNRCILDGRPGVVSWREGYWLRVRFDDTGEESPQLDVDELLQWRRLTYITNPVTLTEPPEGVTQLRQINGVAPPLEGEVRFEFDHDIRLAPPEPDPLSMLTIGTVITVGNAAYQLFRVTYENGLYVYHVNDSEGQHRTFGANTMRALLATSNEEEARRVAVSQPTVATRPNDLQGWCGP